MAFGETWESITGSSRAAMEEMLVLLEKLFQPLNSTVRSVLETRFIQHGFIPFVFVLVSSVSIQRARQILSRNRIKQYLNSSQHRRDIARNMLIGVAVGDSFGAGVEFEDGETIARVCDGTRYVNMRGPYFSRTWGSRYEPGLYTDDTEMTLGLCRCLCDHERNLASISADDMLQSWKREYSHANTWKNWFFWHTLSLPRNGHGSFEHWASGKKTLDEMRQMNAEGLRKYPGNGPVMRCLPLAFVPDDAVVVHLSRLNANSTHPHVKARAASLIMVLAARSFLFDPGMPKEHVILTALDRYLQLCQEHPDHFDQETTEYLQIVDSLVDYHELPSMPLKQLCGSADPIPWASKVKGKPIRGLDSDAMRTVGCVLYLIKYHLCLMDSLLAAVRIGGDVDSIAGVLMGMLCGRYGLVIVPTKSAIEAQPYATSTSGAGSNALMPSNALPDFFIYEMEGLEYIIHIADEFRRHFD